MAVFSFNPVTPHPLLAPYIERMWVFESSGRLPVLDKKLIVPNANFKLTYTHCNGITASIDGKTFVQNENGLTLTGLVDTPVILDPQDDILTRTIVIEFNPLGVYRLFQLSYTEVKNQILDVADLIGSSGKNLQSRLGETSSLEMQINLLQKFLVGRLAQSQPDQIFDYCINRITATHGKISVAQLEKETGYSSRWLHKKFSARLGTGAKNLAEIIRFKQFYEAYAAGANAYILKQHIYEYYHDQSHFIKAFKRFTGFTPTDLENSANELATLHYTN